MSIVVTTPTGNVGSRVVRLLAQAGVRPVVLARAPDRLAADVRPLVEVRQGDLSDADFVLRATQGADALYWVDPTDLTSDDPDARTVRLGGHAAAAVRENGIGRVVLQSSGGAEVGHGFGGIDALARVEALLADTGASTLALRCGYFFTNLLTDPDGLRDGVLSTTLPADLSFPWVDPRDVGEVVAARLLSPGWSGPAVQAVHGPQDLSFAQVAVLLTAVTGRDFEVRVVTDDDVRAGLRSAGLAPAAVESVVGMSIGLRSGLTPEQPRDAVTTTPTTLGAWAWQRLRGA